MDDLLDCPGELVPLRVYLLQDGGQSLLAAEVFQQIFPLENQTPNLLRVELEETLEEVVVEEVGEVFDEALVEFEAGDVALGDALGDVRRGAPLPVAEVEEGLQGNGEHARNVPEVPLVEAVVQLLAPQVRVFQHPVLEVPFQVLQRFLENELQTVLGFFPQICLLYFIEEQVGEFYFFRFHKFFPLDEHLQNAPFEWSQLEVLGAEGNPHE